MSYFHPRDFDPTQPMIEDLSLQRKFKSYVGLKTSKRKLINLLDAFEFTDIATANDIIDWKKVRNIKL